MTRSKTEGWNSLLCVVLISLTDEAIQKDLKVWNRGERGSVRLELGTVGRLRIET